MSDDADTTTDSATQESTEESTEEGTEGGSDSTEGQLTKEQAMGDEDVPEEKAQEIEAEREKRLAPDNRPDNAEIDNSDRDFDVASGQFTDHDTDEDLGPYNDPNAEDGESEA